MTTEGAWFKASVIWFASSWRIIGTFSKASFEQETKILHSINGEIFKI